MKLEEIYEIMHKKGVLLAHLSDPDAEAYLVAAQLIKMSIGKPVVNNRCPNCRRQLRKPIAPKTLLSGRKISRQGDKFCPRCGQALDWTVEQEQEEEKETPYCRNYNCEHCSNFCTNGTICSCESVNVTADLFYVCRLMNCACRNFTHR